MDVVLIIEPETGRPPGGGYVTMADDAAATAAVEAFNERNSFTVAKPEARPSR
ncbi:hypothetical protein DWB77_07469 [Streptomyces hundungensis]|uniref:RRM domain-containing protein n=1 Tax=Streptomyces hundungensis TaxID=1077946 RepID=A0A387HSQ0_9ACTN|nr:hypothetical protein DWB77_07469 [Streptomyces hundungensis]